MISRSRLLEDFLARDERTNENSLRFRSPRPRSQENKTRCAYRVISVSLTLGNTDAVLFVRIIAVTSKLAEYSLLIAQHSAIFLPRVNDVTNNASRIPCLSYRTTAIPRSVSPSIFFRMIQGSDAIDRDHQMERCFSPMRRETAEM